MELAYVLSPPFPAPRSALHQTTRPEWIIVITGYGLEYPGGNPLPSWVPTPSPYWAHFTDHQFFDAVTGAFDGGDDEG